MITMTVEQIAKKFGCTSNQVTNQLNNNLIVLKRMRDKAILTGKKVNGFTLDMLDADIKRIEAKIN